MIWVIASIPFWVIGMFLFVVAVVGTTVTVRDAATIDDGAFKKAVYGAGALYLASGMVLLLAAKICS